MSRKSGPRSKTVEDIPEKKPEPSNQKTEIKLNLDDEHVQELAKKSIELIALRSRALTRRLTKIKSKSTLLGHIDLKISPESFISENTGKFNDCYRIIGSVGQGGYGQVFKVQHKNTGIIRAMKSSPSS